jgi:hypothetical protein
MCFYKRKKFNCYLENVLIQCCLEENLTCELISFIIKIFHFLCKCDKYHFLMHKYYTEESSNFFVNLISDIISQSTCFLKPHLLKNLNCVYYYYGQTVFLPILIKEFSTLHFFAYQLSLVNKKSDKTVRPFQNLFNWFCESVPKI